MKKLFELMDISRALSHAVSWARSVSGMEAAILAFWFTLLTAAFGWLSWYFDIESTMLWAEGIAPSIMLSLGESFLLWGPWILIAISLIPTLMRQSLARPAQSGFHLAAGLLFFIGLFDVHTDWPRIRDFFDTPTMWALFSWAGPAQGLVWFVARLIFTFFATDGFEILFAFSLVSTIVLLMNIGKSSSAAHAR